MTVARQIAATCLAAPMIGLPSNISSLPAGDLDRSAVYACAPGIATRRRATPPSVVIFAKVRESAAPISTWPCMLLLKSENALPVVLHADDDPALLRGLVAQCLGEGADLGVGQPQRGTVGVLALCIVVQDDHRESRAVAGLRVFQHLPVAGRVAERGIRPASDHQVDALWFARVVVVEQQFWLLGKHRPAILVIAVAGSAGAAHNLLGRNAVDLLG